MRLTSSKDRLGQGQDMHMKMEGQHIVFCLCPTSLAPSFRIKFYEYQVLSSTHVSTIWPRILLNMYSPCLDCCKLDRCGCCTLPFIEIGFSLGAWFRENCRQIEAEVGSNSRNKPHQTTYQDFRSRECYGDEGEGRESKFQKILKSLSWQMNFCAQ